MSWIKHSLDWGSTALGLASGNPWVSTGVALVQAGLQFAECNYVGGANGRCPHPLCK